MKGTYNVNTFEENCSGAVLFLLAVNILEILSSPLKRANSLQTLDGLINAHGKTTVSEVYM